MKNTKTTAKQETKKNVNQETKKSTFYVWARNKQTRELVEFTVEAAKLSDVASLVRATGDFSFRTAATKENFEAAKAKWIDMNAKSIAYHKEHDNKEKFEKTQATIEILKANLSKKDFAMVIENLNLSKYVK